MARRKRGAKTEAIKDMIAEHPEAKTSEIVKLLAGKGIKVSSTYVYGLKTAGKVKKAKAKHQKALAASNGVADPIAVLRGLKELAEKAGGIQKLKEYVEILAE